MEIMWLLVLGTVFFCMYVTSLGNYVSQVWFAFFMSRMNPKYNAAVVNHKAELFQQLQQHSPQKKEMTILEIGCGPGGNLQLYPKDVFVNLVAVEPNVHHKSYLEDNLKKYDNINLEKFIICKAENMASIESDSIETVVSTIVLCSVDNQAEVLLEIKRVLKPGGKFYFMEHVVSEAGTWLYRFQHIFNKIWSILLDGCEVTRDTKSVIQSAGFADVQVKRFSASKLGFIFYPVFPHIYGYAVKGDNDGR